MRPPLLGWDGLDRALGATATASPYGNWGASPWKGSQLGRPAQGPGALANPGRRLAARVLNTLLLTLIALLIAAPYFGPIFPTIPRTNSASSVPTPGFLWLYLTLIGCVLATGVVMVAYGTVATARYGRTLGEAWLHIRPVRTDGTLLGWGRSLGRITIYWASGFVSWFGLLDPLWCCWDGISQCHHDKVVDTIVINDPAP